MVSLEEVPEGNKAENQGEDRKQSSIHNDPMECPEGVETTLKGWFNYFRRSICGQPFARTWEYADKRIGLMHSRCKQRVHRQTQKDLELFGLKLSSQNTNKRYNA